MKRIAVVIGLLLLLVGTVVAYRWLLVPWQHSQKFKEVISSKNNTDILNSRQELLENKWSDLGIFKEKFFNDICQNLERTDDYAALDAQFMMITDYFGRIDGEGSQHIITPRQKEQIENAAKRFNEETPYRFTWELHEHDGKYYLQIIPPAEE